MNNLSLEKTLSNVDLLSKTLSHKNPAVKVLGINEMSRIVRHAPSAIQNPDIVLSLIECLKSDEYNVGTSCINLLVAVLPPFLTLKAVKSNLEQTFEAPEVVQCRTYEIGVKIGRQSPELLERVEFILDRMVADLNSDDILLQLNVLKLLSEFPTAQHGLVYLENKGVFANLLKKIEMVQQHPLGNLQIPGLMEFFGNVGSIHPSKVFEEYPAAVNALFDCIQTNEYNLLPTGYDTLGYLSRTADGKKYFDHRFGPRIRDVLADIGSNIKSLPTELKIRALECLSNLFYIAPDQLDNQITCITESWYATLSPDNQNLQFVLIYAQNPFPDIKTAAFILLKSISLHKWGHQRLQKTGGFIEFLLDRNTEFEKDLIRTKYEIIQVLSESNVFNVATIVQLKKYVSEGAFFVQSVNEVAFESQG